jgi:hypothetical protein
MWLAVCQFIPSVCACVCVCVRVRVCARVRREFIQLGGCLQQLETIGPSFCHQHTAGALGLGQVLVRCQCHLAAGESVRQSLPCSHEGLFV